MDDVKIVGLCLARIQDNYKSDLILELHKQALKLNYRLIVFNSFVDFYKKGAFDIGTSAVYKLVDADCLDALIIDSESIHDDELVRSVINRAKYGNIPVLIFNGEFEGCYSIKVDYTETYKELLRHVFAEHNVKDSYYIAGLENEENSIIRENCYKEVLTEFGIEFSEDMVGYGEYWGLPARRLVDKLCADAKKPPRAVLCANDNMAIDVIEQLNDYGYRVPEDVIVTGFDGSILASCSKPMLSTCKPDNSKISEAIFEILESAIAGNKPYCVVKDLYMPIMTESCGCERNKRHEIDAAEIFYDYWNNFNHEQMVSGYTAHSITISEINELCDLIKEWIEHDSCVFLNENLIASLVQFKGETIQSYEICDNVLIFPGVFDSFKLPTKKMMQCRDLIPNMDDFLKSNKSYLINSLYVGGEVLGFYGVFVDDYSKEAIRVMRTTKSLNIAFNSVINYYREKALRLNAETAKKVNPITELPNLKALNEWFEDFAEEESKNKTLVVTVYKFERFNSIYENFGLEEIEAAVRFVAESIKFSNISDTFISHISNDEFVVINYFDKKCSNVKERIDNQYKSVDNMIATYNRNLEKEYKIIISRGLAEIESGFGKNLPSFIKAATAVMYMNNLKGKKKNEGEVEVLDDENIRLYQLLIKNNLFEYHFQPIVNATDGEICAFEALMRTPKNIGLNPLQIIATAKKCNGLYDLEKATFFNVLKCYKDNLDSFAGRKIFINSIPGYFLTDEDRKKFLELYEHYIENIVVEITEENSLTDEELMIIKGLGDSGNKFDLAIDDFGTGHSNIVNLIRYSPKIIKVDRFLVENIDSDKNKAMFFKNTVDFARLNDIKVLAEGVETKEELKKVIELGTDYIQGYFTGRPSPSIISELEPEIKQLFVDFNCE